MVVLVNVAAMRLKTACTLAATSHGVVSMLVAKADASSSYYWAWTIESFRMIPFAQAKTILHWLDIPADRPAVVLLTPYLQTVSSLSWKYEIL